MLVTDFLFLQKLLPNLEKLDLSYNVIEKIENLAVSQLKCIVKRTYKVNEVYVNVACMYVWCKVPSSLSSSVQSLPLEITPLPVSTHDMLKNEAYVHIYDMYVPVHVHA